MAGGGPGLHRASREVLGGSKGREVALGGRWPWRETRVSITAGHQISCWFVGYFVKSRAPSLML